MVILASVCYILAAILFLLDLLFGLPVVPSPESPARSWRGIPVTLGLFFLAAGLFLANGGLPH